MKKLFTLAFITAFICISAQAQTNYYVSAVNGNDNNAGTSMASPYKTLQKAIASMTNNADAVINIIIEKGTYKPTDGQADPNNREASFILNRSVANQSAKKLRVLGGYDFTTGQRDYVNNATILSGNIGDPNSNSDNSYHVGLVVRQPLVTPDSIEISGLTISDGAANAFDSTTYQLTSGSTLQIPNNTGGGLELLSHDVANLVIKNCIFSNNAAYVGGAILSSFSALRAENCVFENNQALYDNAHPSSRGGGAYVFGATTKFIGCVFYANKGISGSALTMANIDGVDLIVSACTFVANDNIFPNQPSHVIYDISPTGRFEMTNSILSGNGPAGQTNQSALYLQGATGEDPGTATIQVSSNILQYFGDIQYAIGIIRYSNDPSYIKFINRTNPKGADGKWMTADDGFQLTHCTSPAWELGENTVGLSGIPNPITSIATDITGRPRKVLDWYDVGAYESQYTGEVYYIDNDGDGYGVNLIGGLGQVHMMCGAAPPAGYVNNNNDCNDNEAASYPGAVEICDGVDNDCDGIVDNGFQTHWYLDADADGYGDDNNLVISCTSIAGRVNTTGDCNDNDNTVYPGAPELCDNKDNDCNGQIDDGIQVAYYIDNDGDGFGNAFSNTPVFSCSPIPGRAPNNTDCDDQRNDVYPGAPELCDGRDNNCNGLIDDGIKVLYYWDTDGDGYGRDNVTQLSCSPIPQYVTRGGDCDDNNNTIYPNAPELCDLLDNNCNGVIDEGFTKTRYYRDIDSDGYGDPNVFFDLCDPAAGYVTNNGDCNDLNGNIHPGVVEIVGNNIDDNCNGLIDEPNTWTGTVSSDWHTAGNWSAGVVPTVSTDGTIPANVSRFPVLSADASVRVLDIKPGASVTIGANTLTVDARMPGRGVLRGSAASNLVLGFSVGTTFPANADTLWMDQSTDGATNILNSLRYLSGNGGLPLGNKLIILDYYEPYATGTLFSDGNLVLRSTASKTARVMAPTFNNVFSIKDRYIQGDVTVERYLPMNEFQAWRMLAVPVKGTQTIKQAWQENQSAGIVGTTGLGTTITTAAGYLQNGFDAITTKTSIQTFNPATGGLINCTSTLLPIESKYGYFMYIRGDRSVAINSSTTPVNATTLRTKGTLYLGPQQPVTITANKYLMVGNPYACPVDFTQLVRTGGIGATFYIWDPRLHNGSSLGAYQTFSAVNGYQPVLAGGSYSGTNTRIESGMAIMVYASGAAGSIQFTEAAKIGGSSNNGFRPAKLPASIKISLMKKDNVSAEMIAADAGIIAFDDRYSSEVNGDDAVKMMNPAENISIINEQTQTALAIEARGRINDKSESVPLLLSNINAENYRLQFDFTEYAGLNSEVFIEDSKTSTVTQVTPANNIYEFTADSKSGNSNRFRIVFKKAVTAEASFITVSPNPNTGSTMNITYNGLAGGKASIRLMDVKGTVIYNHSMQVTANKGIQLINLPYKPTGGVYMIEMVDASGKHLIKKVIFN